MIKDLTAACLAGAVPCFVKADLRYMLMNAGCFAVNGKADIRIPLRSMLMNAGCFAACQKGLLTPSDISIPLDPRLRLFVLEAGDCLFCVQFLFWLTKLFSLLSL